MALLEESGEINHLAGPHLIIEGCNVHVRSGSGDTSTIDGTGNLIVGHNELDFFGGAERTGSNNLVVGRAHGYSSYGGFIAGEANTVTAPAATASGGRLCYSQRPKYILVFSEALLHGPGSGPVSIVSCSRIGLQHEIRLPRDRLHASRRTG